MNKFDDLNNMSDIDNPEFFDPTTHIISRQKFDAMLSHEIERAKETIRYLSLLIIDINAFDQYINTYGRLAADNCSHQIALALTGIFKRSGDLVAKWSNTEFICLLSDTDSIGAIKMAEKAKKTIADLNIVHAKSSADEVVTLSVGIATSILTENITSDELLQKAKQSLLAARKDS
ncbi:diguanylate cyclase domain-containing protein [Acetobacterium woodii]|uniref:Response regulator receiver modulated diguanylate cyclase n=1 Tax=Acetobacterium woodii (strain ATCC 29683 / DSM 1030 / JCM 2381 / KCTC 1655 / WB1) TaxID=931626 RepID=H6LH73_ACEWD|nr:diguanylate cyclase [Acetobacterium woodii]AFA48411.1 response regulator receiver modulated diguanylate cyclase [Acetobacterium woodii DSM 1030]